MSTAEWAMVARHRTHHPSSASQVANRARAESAEALAEAARREAERHRVAAEREQGELHLLDSFEIAPENGTPASRVRVIVVERVRRKVTVVDLERTLGLTRREAEVALALSERLSSAEIARALGISPHTVRRHSERVLEKLGVRSRRDVGEVLRCRMQNAQNGRSQ